MNKHAIFHETLSQYAYHTKNKTVRIILRVAHDDIDSVVLLHGDPFVWTKVSGKYYFEMYQDKMNILYETDLFDYYMVEVEAPLKRLRYAFLIEDKDNNQEVYHAHGYSKPEKDLLYNNVQMFFNIPYLHEADKCHTPEWVKDRIWYQIFPDRFYGHNNQSKLDWNNSEVDNMEHYGGNLKGITEKLPYLKDLGINGLYLTPIFKAITAHKYDTCDYMEIDPRFGTKKDLKELVEKAHELDFKIILDGVFNHSGVCHAFIQDVFEKEEKSKYAECFHIKKHPAKNFDIDLNKIYMENEELPNYETFALTPYMPKWNTTSLITQKHLLGVVEYWIKEFDIDGWRLDVSNELSFDFLRKLKIVARNTKKSTHILGENWDQSLPWLRGDTLDAVMNYYLTELIWDFVDGKLSPKQYKNNMVEYLINTPTTIINNQFNLIGSHDTERVFTRVGNNYDKLKIAYVLLFTAHGAPCLYYGDEVAMEGKGDPDCRKTMEWNPNKEQLKFKEFIKDIIKLRKKYHTYNSDIKFIDDNDLVIYQTEKLLVIINYNGKSISKTGLEKRITADLLTKKEVNLNRLHMDPYSFIIVERDEA